MDKDLAREVERLQAQVAALTEKIGDPAAAPRPSGAQASASASFSLGDLKMGDSKLGDALHKAADALPEWKEIEAAVASLKSELEKHPVTGIAVAFALGLTIGQLLRR